MQKSTSSTATFSDPQVPDSTDTEWSPPAPEEVSTVVSGCRRESIRGSFGGEVHLVVSGRRIKGVIRDVSFSDETDTVGVGILHHDLIPLEEQVPCRIVGTESLPAEASLVLKWSRSFGSRGLLSGGQLLCSDHGRSDHDGS